MSNYTLKSIADVAGHFESHEAEIEALRSQMQEFENSSEKTISNLKAANNELLERVEEFEAKGAIPRRGGEDKPAHKSFPVGDKTMYVLPSTTKLADVVCPPEQKISFDRFMGALVCRSGRDECRDLEAKELLESKQLLTTTTGISIPVEYVAEWIDLLRSFMALNSAGMTTVTMTGQTQQHSALASDPGASWHTEAGPISPSNPTFVNRTLTAQTLVTRCQASLELSQDSPDFGGQLVQAMARAMAQELDRVGLLGSGSAPQPQGILGATGVNQLTSIGTPTDYSNLVSAVRTLLDNNVPLDVATQSAIMAPAIWEVYENLPTGISGDITPLPRPRSLEQTRFLTTSAIPTTSPENYTTFMGDFRDCVLGMRQEASIEILKVDSYVDNLVLEFIGYLRADFMLRRPASFVTLEGMTA